MNPQYKKRIVRTVYVILLVGAVYGWLLAEKKHAIEQAILIRTVQQAQEYLRENDSEGLAAELSKCEEDLFSGKSPYHVLLDFQGPDEKSRATAE